MKVQAQSHTYDGTGRAGFCPFEFATRAATQKGILQAWTAAANAEYNRHLEFQREHRAVVEKFDASAEDGVCIMEASATVGRSRYRLTAYAEQGGTVYCGAFDLARQAREYAEERRRIESLKSLYQA